MSLVKLKLSQSLLLSRDLYITDQFSLFYLEPSSSFSINQISFISSLFFLGFEIIFYLKKVIHSGKEKFYKANTTPNIFVSHTRMRQIRFLESFPGYTLFLSCSVFQISLDFFFSKISLGSCFPYSQEPLIIFYGLQIDIHSSQPEQWALSISP